MPGTGFSSDPLIQLKMVVFAPMPSASVRIVMHAYPGALTSTRRAYFTSCAKVDIGVPSGGPALLTEGVARMFHIASRVLFVSTPGQPRPRRPRPGGGPGRHLARGRVDRRRHRGEGPTRCPADPHRASCARLRLAVGESSTHGTASALGAPTAPPRHPPALDRPGSRYSRAGARRSTAL